MIQTYKEDDYIPSEVEIYHVAYKDGATYEYGPGYARLIENIPADVLRAQHKGSWTIPAKPTIGISWFDGAGLVLFFMLIILPLLLCILAWGVYPALLISGIEW